MLYPRTNTYIHTHGACIIRINKILFCLIFIVAKPFFRNGPKSCCLNPREFQKFPQLHRIFKSWNNLPKYLPRGFKFLNCSFALSPHQKKKYSPLPTYPVGVGLNYAMRLHIRSKPTPPSQGSLLSPPWIINCFSCKVQILRYVTSFRGVTGCSWRWARPCGHWKLLLKLARRIPFFQGSTSTV